MAIITTKFVLCLYYLQERTTAIEMADKLRDNGKIYVVVAIVIAILLGVLIYLISLDRKITKLENNKK